MHANFRRHKQNNACTAFTVSQVNNVAKDAVSIFITRKKPRPTLAVNRGRDRDQAWLLACNRNNYCDSYY